jgi:hypothetical protein
MWIPWDHNEAFATTPGITGSTNTGGPGGVSRTGVSLSMNEVATSWPLLNYVANDPVYMAKYKTYLKSFNTSVYTNEAIGALCDKYQALISPYAIGANGEQAKHTYITSSASFTSAFSTLKSHVASRKILVSSYVP